MAFKVTVEPVAFLYMLSSFMVLTGLQDLIYAKVCFTKYPASICENLFDEKNKDALSDVQASSSFWILASNLNMYLPSILSAYFIGSWSDMYETKLPMLLPPVGNAFSTLLYIWLSVFLVKGPMALILVSSFIAGLTGGYPSSLLTCFNYISRITNGNERTFRISIIEGMVYFAGFVGPLLTGWIQSVFGRNYVFVTIMSVQTILIMYIIFFVENLIPRQQPENSQTRTLFSLKHLKDSFATVFRRRPENRRTYVWLLISMIAVYKLCQACDLDVTYIYVKDKILQWDITEYSWYFSLKHTIGALSLVALLPFLRKFPDAILMIIAFAGYILGFIVLGLAVNSAMVYSVSVTYVIGAWCLPVVRSAVSKLVEIKEQGKTFAFLAVVENVFMLIGSAVFNGIYPATRDWFHGFVFILAAILLFIPFGIAGFLYKRLERISSYVTVIEIEKDEEEEQAERNSLDSSSLSVSSETPVWGQASDPPQQLMLSSEITDVQQHVTDSLQNVTDSLQHVTDPPRQDIN